jgi:hypothetical protein
MSLRVRSRTTGVLEYAAEDDNDDNHEFDLTHEASSSGEVIVKKKPDGGFVVGYLSNDSDCSHPLEDCDGCGRILDGRTRRNDEYWARRESPGPYDVLLDVYSHGGDAWRIHNDGTYFPDEQWDVSNCAGIWYPDDACLEHIEHTAIMGDLPAEFSIEYCATTDAGTAITIVYNGLWHQIPMMVAGRKWRQHPSKAACWRLYRGPFGYKSFTTAAKALRRMLGVQQSENAVKRRARKVAIACAAIAVDEYNKWLMGDCYGVCVDTFDAECDKIADDACWGYIGREYAMEELTSRVEWELKHAAENQGQAVDA